MGFFLSLFHQFVLLPILSSKLDFLVHVQRPCKPRSANICARSQPQGDRFLAKIIDFSAEHADFMQISSNIFTHVTATLRRKSENMWQEKVQEGAILFMIYFAFNTLMVSALARITLFFDSSWYLCIQSWNICANDQYILFLKVPINAVYCNFHVNCKT